MTNGERDFPNTWEKDPSPNIYQRYERLTKERDAYRDALEGMVLWFGNYPEFVPVDERMDEVVSCVHSARKTLSQFKEKK